MNANFLYSKDLRTKVGILGGGQLAALLARSARTRDCEIFVYVNSIVEPACAWANHVFVGKVDDRDGLKDFFKLCDVVLLESEFFDPHTLSEVSQAAKVNVFPGLNAYEQLFSKENQKAFFSSINVPCVPYLKINQQEDLKNLNFDGPYIVKLSHGGYDGYGNFELNTKSDLLEKIDEFTQNYTRTVLIEKRINIKNEFASLLIKNQKGHLILPACQTFQEESICKLVKYPAQIDKNSEQAIMSIMETLNQNIHDTGIYAFEFFEDVGGNVYINEAAPRVHNSYHYTIEAFNKSQFDLFLDAVLDCELKMPQQQHAHLTMVNILGQSQSEKYSLEFPNLNGNFDFKIHMYGKKECKPGRKMGHVTLFGPDENYMIGQKLSQEYRI